MIRAIAVYCGASSGHDPIHSDNARALGAELARRGIRLIYGGGGGGLMGVVANAALDAGGEAVGVFPAGLQLREAAHPRLTALHIVSSMHERKAMMADLADAFVALPGGFGTLDELFEVLTWSQLGIHGKPIALLDPTGYYDRLLAFIDFACEQGFLRPAHRALLQRDTDPQSLLERLAGTPEQALEHWAAAGDPR